MKFELNVIALLALASSAVAGPMRVAVRQLNTTTVANSDGGSPAKFLSYTGYGVYDGYGTYGAYGTYLGYTTYPQAVEEAAKAKAREASPDALPHPAPVKRAAARETDFESYKDYGSYGTYEDYK